MQNSQLIIVFYALLRCSECNWGWGNRNGWNGGYGQHGGHHQPNYLSYQYEPVPVVTTTTTQAPAKCYHPKKRNPSIFLQKCFLPNESTETPCLSHTKVPMFPSGTTAVTSCKPPEYYNEQGEFILEICQEGTWNSDGKLLTCRAYVLPTTTPTPEPKPPVRNHYDTNYNTQWYTPSNQAYHQTQTTTETPISYPAWHPPSTTTTTTTLPPSTTTTTLPPPTTTTPTSRPYYEIDWRTDQDRDPIPSHPLFNYISQTTEAPRPIESSSKCPPLPPKTGAIIECLSKTQKLSGSGYTISVSECEEPQVTGTEATYKCKMYYEPISSGITTQYRTCKENGVWSGNDEEFGCRLECGKSNPGGRLPLITSGETTVLGQWPWHAGLFIRERAGVGNACGGTLVSHRAILSAAHCVTLTLSSITRDLDDIRVDLGRYYRDRDDPYVQKLQVEKIETHPAYNPFLFESDIAIIILKESVKIGFHVRPICYPKSQNAAFDELQLADGAFATVVGWGADENGERPDELRAAKIQLVGYKDCIESFGQADGAQYAKSTTFCATNKNGTNVCQGDSGGGAYFSVKTSSGSTKWYLQGLVSLGINASKDNKRTCDPEKVSIFTRVSPYADWIVKTLSLNDAL